MGSIEVRIQNGYELDELHNVLITSAANGDILVYDSTTQLWKNTKTLNGTYNFTGLSATSLSAGTATFGTISVDSPTLSVDAANDRVGFGTATPAYKNDFAVEARFGAQVRDENGAAGNNLDIFTSTGSTARWRSRSDLSIPTTTATSTNKFAYFSDGPGNIITAFNAFVTDGLKLTIGQPSMAAGPTYDLAIDDALLMVGSAPTVHFRNASYANNSYYSFKSAAGTGTNPGNFTFSRTILGSEGAIFDFTVTSSIFRFYTQLVATTIATDPASVWTLGRHFAGSVTPDGNYVQITINGTTYKLVTAA
jgi:hypothetical protein